MEVMLLLAFSVLAILVSLSVLARAIVPRWVGLYRINTQSLSRVALPVLASLGIFFAFPNIPPCLANIVTLLIPRKREELAKLDYAIQERNPRILGREWEALYQQIATTGKIPPAAIGIARGRANTLTTVVTLALHRDEQLLSATQAALRAAETKLQAARSQAMSVIVFPYIATIISTIFWLVVPPLSGMADVGVPLRLLQVISVAIAAAGTEVIFRALS